MPSVLFAKCVTNNTSEFASRWYKLGRWGFETQGSAFNPTVTSYRQTPKSNELNSANGSTTPPSIPVTTVIVTTAGGAAVFVALSSIVVLILLRKVKRQRKKIEMTNEEIDEFMLGVAAEKANAKGINGLFVLPYDTRLEIPKAEVHFRKAKPFARLHWLPSCFKPRHKRSQ